MFENRRIFGEDMDKSLRLTFLAHPVDERYRYTDFVRVVVELSLHENKL